MTGTKLGPMMEMKETPMTDLKTALDKFVADVKKLSDEHMTTRFPNLSLKNFTVEPGRRYARVVCTDGNSRYVYCFVDLTNGDILKAASWKKPAKHARGNVFTYAAVTDCVSPYGAHYL